MEPSLALSTFYHPFVGDGGRKGYGVDPIRYLCQRNLVPPHFRVTFSRALVLYFGANDFWIPGANDFLMTFVVMASAAPSPACLACGELSQKRDRRVIGGSNTSEAIILLWKRVISKGASIQERRN